MQKMRGNCPDEALERFDAVRNAYEAKTPILPSPPMYGTRTKPVPLKKGVATSEILQALETLAKDDGNGLATLVKLIWKRSSYDQKYRPDMTAIDELVTGIIGLY
ncbi:MAG: hypothetical protein DI628_03350 [Blastochloris viridis]|uniref:Uncharacterized protein n=1 Tax=Blastochloris viridis TaxID=1079 RepID=A0A6N4RD79_BLAVI|nr:MAG: hypothetical protein DI628_03350 [Blastochloris viridis]